MKIEAILAAATLVACSGNSMDASTKEGESPSAAITADCENVVPFGLGAAQSAPGSFRWISQADDGIGHVVFGQPRSDDPSQSDAIWTIFPTDQGSSPAPIAAMEGQDMFPTGCQLSLQSQPSGFTGVDCTNGQQTLRTWSHNGVLEHSYVVAASSAEAASFAIDPSGGTVAFHQYATGASWHMDFQRYDKTGLLTVNVPFITGAVSANRPIGPFIRAIGVNLAGHALVILEDLQNGGLEGAWMEKTGVSHPFFATTVHPLNQGFMQFLPDGTLALQEDGGLGWHSVFTDLGRTALPAPAWMQQGIHRFSPFFTIRGGRAIAIEEQGDIGGIDLISAAGNNCGQISLDVSSGWAVGRDGTLAILPGPSNGTAHWYPQLLK